MSLYYLWFISQPEKTIEKSMIVLNMSATFSHCKAE